MRQKLSILVPVRAIESSFALERLALRESTADAGAHVILTDDGSDGTVGERLHAFCKDRGWTYQRLDTADRPFSLARARNAGLRAAGCEWVYFDDLDMAYPAGFFARLLRELPLIDDTPLDFVSLPTPYLNKEASDQVIEAGGLHGMDERFLSLMQFDDPRGSDDNRLIEHFAPASALLAMRRETALAVGGFDERFEGWGGEDRDFIFRLLVANPRLPRPNDFAATKAWNLNDARTLTGWRSLFRLHGDYCARKGLYAFHLFHEPNAWRRDRSNIETAARLAADTALAPIVETDAHRQLRHSLLFSAYREDGAAGAVPRVRRPKGPSLLRRLGKLRRDPHAFFRDSRLPCSSVLARLFPARDDIV